METAISQQQISMADILWTLFQSQTKSVRKILTQRIIALDKEEREKRKRKTKSSPELHVRLDAIRQEMKDGNCVVCNTQEELDSFFDAL